MEQAESEYTTKLLRRRGDVLTWNREPEQPFYCELAGWDVAETGMYWEIIHQPGRLGVRESGDFHPERIALWGERHVISPEVFADISILPRHSKDWSRSYQFFAF